MALPLLSILDTTAEEGATATFDVVLDAPSAETVTVEWATGSDTGPHRADGFIFYTMVNGVKSVIPLSSIALFYAYTFSDFFHDFGTLTFAPGETRRSIAIPIHANGMPDALAETFRVVLSNAAGATVADGIGVSTILDSEMRTPPRIQLEDAVAREPYHGLGGTAALEFRVRLSNPYFETVAVDYATQDGSALAGADFAAVSGTLTFAPGETEALISVPVQADTAAEDDEMMSLAFSNPQGATLDPDWPGVVGGQILDMPVPPPRPDAAHFSLVMNRALTYPLALPVPGPVAGLTYLLVTADDDEAVLATGLGDFLQTRGGNDAANGDAGGDVLDGGNGGNILTGGAGTDLFFIDARGRDQPVWTTVTDLEPGERAVLWGLAEPDATLEWADGWGLPGLGGLTLLVRGIGQPVALTLTGYRQLDMQTGHLATAFGHDPGSSQDYFYVAAI